MVYRAWSINSVKDDGYDLRMLIPGTEAATQELPAYIGRVKARMFRICALVRIFRGQTGTLKPKGPSDPLRLG